MTHRGFTFIELMVVLAIIGILASIVLMELGRVNDKALDTRIKIEANNIARQAAIYYADHGNYDLNPGIGICESQVTLAAIRHVFPSYNPNNVTTQFGINCNDDIQYWAISIPLFSKPAFWCVDSAGFVGERASTIPEGAVCRP